ncbi:histone H3.3 type c [Rhagoletis pomonella]|uniref:histone H3.3 type c n=1 Tax=Rhagoletis pomonella TaxID=28610 RepID=UPI001782E03E|nr:histone H3.3 type c [Rhagoletis pomonella]
MRPIQKPGPKSKSRQNPHKQPVADLGETSTSSETDTTFYSPPRDENVTDYGLDFSNTSRRSRAPTTATPRDTAASSSREVAMPPTASTSRALTTRRKQQVPNRRELRKLLNRTDFMIPRLAFGRVVREIMVSLGSEVHCITLGALEGLQAATEVYIENRFEDVNMLAMHCRRKTIMVRDMELIQFLMSKNCVI